MQKWCAVTLLVTLCCVGSVSVGAKQQAAVPFFDSPEFKGESFKPPQPFVMDRLFKDNSGLADWELVYDWPIEITSIRIITVEADARAERYDWTTNDEVVLKTVAGSLSAGRMRRLALSDFAHHRGRVMGGGLSGVMIIERMNRKLIIGFGEAGFYLGVSHGTGHQIFESWMLAKQLDEVIFQKTGEHLPHKVFEGLTGEANIKKPQKAYEAIRGIE